MELIAVYGTLKKGKYNHHILENSHFIGDTTLKGKMYLLTTFPALTREGDNYYSAEVYNVEESIYNDIVAMEYGAGYYALKVDTEYGKATVFYYKDSEWLRARFKEIYEY